MLSVQSMPLTGTPFEYSSYLLASSPPTFELFPARGASNLLCNKPTSNPDEIFQDFQCDISGLPRSRSDSNVSVGGSATSIPAKSGLRTPNSPKPRKNVSFADQLGKTLVTIKVLGDTPIKTPITYYKSVNKYYEDDSQGPQLKLNFEQPAAQYVTFHERLLKDFVSLENVLLKGLKVAGTIKVKNITFEKKVTVRVTFDKWKTSDDVIANYVESTCSSSNYDTFAFEFQVPDRPRVSSATFCVCYEANNQHYWDNNSGRNYEVSSAADWYETSRSTEFNHRLFAQDHWSEYSAWKGREYLDVPYW